VRRRVARLRRVSDGIGKGAEGEARGAPQESGAQASEFSLVS